MNRLQSMISAGVITAISAASLGAFSVAQGVFDGESHAEGTRNSSEGSGTVQNLALVMPDDGGAGATDVYYDDCDEPDDDDCYDDDRDYDDDDDRDHDDDRDYDDDRDHDDDREHDDDDDRDHDGDRDHDDDDDRDHDDDD